MFDENAYPGKITPAAKKKYREHFNVFTPYPNQLTLDYDTSRYSPDAHPCLPPKDLMNILEQELGAVESERWISKNGGLHVVISCDRTLSPATRVALQAALGSDPKREILAICTLENPSFLNRPIPGA